MPPLVDRLRGPGVSLSGPCSIILFMVIFFKVGRGGRFSFSHNLFQLAQGILFIRSTRSTRSTPSTPSTGLVHFFDPFDPSTPFILLTSFDPSDPLRLDWFIFLTP